MARSSPPIADPLRAYVGIARAVLGREIGDDEIDLPLDDLFGGGKAGTRFLHEARAHAGLSHEEADLLWHRMRGVPTDRHRRRWAWRTNESLRHLAVVSGRARALLDARSGVETKPTIRSVALTFAGRAPWRSDLVVGQVQTPRSVASFAVAFGLSGLIAGAAAHAIFRESGGVVVAPMTVPFAGLVVLWGGALAPGLIALHRAGRGR